MARDAASCDVSAWPVRIAAKQAFAAFVYEYESRCLLNAGVCGCGRCRDRLDTPILRERLDKLVAAINDEPTTIDASRGSLIEVDER